MPPHPRRPEAAADARPASRVLSLRVDALSRADTLERAKQLLTASRCAHIVTANALLALEAEADPILKQACDDADLVTADSVGLTWAAPVAGQPPLERYPGIELAFDLCGAAASAGHPVFLLGAAPGVAEEASRFLKAAHPGLQIAGIGDGFFDPDDDEVLEAVRISGARLLLVALGMPKQELWIAKKRGELPPGAAIGVGGSFDVWAGRLKRAPGWVRRLGLEWGFRWAQEPSRWGRMLQLPRFAWKVWRGRRVA